MTVSISGRLRPRHHAAGESMVSERMTESAGRLRGGRLWWGLPALLSLLWLAGFTSVVSYPGLPSPPDIVVWLMPATRFARDIAAALTVGAVVVGGLLMSFGSSRVLRWARIWAAAWLSLVVLGLVLTRSEVESLSPLEALAPGSLPALLFGEIVGRVFLGQVVALIAIVCITSVMGSRAATLDPRARASTGQSAAGGLAWACALLAIGAAAAPAFAGHAGLHDSHTAATVSLLLHISAVSLWVGGLAVVVALGRVDPDAALAVLPRFSALALWCVVLVAETGLLNASLRLSLPSEFVGTFYGSLIIGKAVLLGWLVALGYRQRRGVVAPSTQTTAEPVGVTAMLARYAAWEFLIMGMAVAVSVALARIGPAPAEAATGAYSPVALAVLAIGLPMLLAWLPGVRAASGSPRPERASARVRTRPRSTGRVLRWLMAHSELPAVVLLVVVADIAGLQALNAMLGDQLGTVVGVLVIIGAGWLWATCTASGQGWSGILVMMVGWPIVMWVNSLGQGASIDPGVRMTIATVIAVELLLGLKLVAGRARRTRRTTSVGSDAMDGEAPASRVPVPESGGPAQ